MTADPVHARPSPAALEAAADWIDRLGELSPAEAAELDAWLAASDEHGRAWSAMEALLGDQALGDAMLRVRAAEREPMAAPIAPARRTRGRQGLRWGRLQVGVPIAACLAGIAFLAIQLERPRTPAAPPPAAPVEYATQTGARADARLKDNSLVHLDAGSAVRVAFTARSRELELERGEAMFEVAHDAARPFDVGAGGAVVTAVGTIFDVERLKDEVTVGVLQGVVRVRSPAGDVRLLHAGEQLSFTGAQPAVFRRISKDMARTWRSNWWQADGMPLGQIVERLNRYSGRPIVLDSADLARQPITGSFDLRRPDSTVALLSALLDLKVSRQDGDVHLARRGSPAAPAGE